MIPREPEETTPENPAIKEESAPAPEQDLEKTLAYTKQKADDYLDSWKRAQADFVNYKRRTEQERLEIGKYANSELILSLLPVLDDFERAFESIPPRVAKTAWVDGIRLVERKLRATLAAQGLTAIKTEGETFDPNQHEAVMHSKGEDGKVVLELQKGYKLFDKILRPSKVAVGNGEPVEKPKEEDKQDLT
jgi:molecular chaperone GrpE